MADSIAVKITADVVDLQTKFALARAESSAFSTELNKLAKEAVNAGGATPQLSAQMTQVATNAAAAKTKLNDLRSQMTQNKEGTLQLAEGVSTLREGLAMLGIAASIEGLVEFSKGAFEAAEQIYHEAEVLSMSTTAYQAFANSARIAGVSVETVDTALRKFNASQGQAETGVGNQAKAFNDLGVSAKLPAEEALPAVARALLAIEDPARRARDEVALFGRAGEELNPALEQWARGVTSLTASLKEQGLIQSEDVVKGAHDAKVAMDRAWLQAETTWAKPIVGISHAIEGLGLLLNKIPEWAGEAATALGKLGLSAEGYDISKMGATSEAAKPYVIPSHGEAGPPKPNFTDSNDAKKAAQEARQIADERAKIFEQGALRHIAAQEQENNAILSLGRESMTEWVNQAYSLENQRYAAELKGIKDREAADKGDKVRLAADLAEEAQLEAAHTERLDALHLEYLGKQKAERDAELQQYIADEQARLQEGKAAIEDEFKNHQISAQQRHDMEVQLTQTIEAEVLKRLDAEIAGLAQGTAAYAAAMKQRQALEIQFTKQIQQANNQLADQEMQKWKTLGESISQSIGQAFNQMILHGGSFGSFMQSVAEGVATAFLDMGEKMLAEYVLEEIFGSADAASGASLQIGANAAVAGSAAFAATAAIPIIGPELAPEAGAAAYGAAMAYEAMIPAFAVGTNFVPEDMTARIHAGERIIPAADNRALMAALNGTRAASSDIHVHVHAIDTQSGVQFLRNHMPRIAKDLAAYQTANPSVRPGY